MTLSTNFTAIRARILSAFERAEVTESEEERRALLTFVVVGGGPTGVELAGAIAELASKVVARDFRHIDASSAHVLLVLSRQSSFAAAQGHMPVARAAE